MLENIKSSFFIKLLYSNIKEEMKLKIVKYNKHLQYLLDINLNNYKLFKGRYIIYEENGQAKEFNIFNDKLIYEGEYFNGKRNGKGKEYNISYDGLIYEGEYLNGKRNGKGKEYDKEGLLKFLLN